MQYTQLNLRCFKTTIFDEVVTWYQELSLFLLALKTTIKCKRRSAPYNRPRFSMGGYRSISTVPVNKAVQSKDEGAGGVSMQDHCIHSPTHLIQYNGLKGEGLLLIMCSN